MRSGVRGEGAMMSKLLESLLTPTQRSQAQAADKAATLAHYAGQAALTPRRFLTVYCSQCGSEFTGAARDAGFSACREHSVPSPSWAAA